MAEMATISGPTAGASDGSSRPFRANVADLALQHGRTSPGRVALVAEDGDGRLVPLTYQELLEAAETLAAGVQTAGLGPGSRIALLFKPSIDFYALLLAALASDLVVVLIDASLPRSGVRRALRDARIDAIATYRRVLRWWPLIPELRGVTRISVDGRCFMCSDITSLNGAGRLALLDRDGTARDEAVISFTSGTSGTPRSAHRGHELLLAQHEVLKSTFPLDAGACAMPCFPLVVLHNLCSGVTSVLPPLDPRAPDDASTARTIRALESWQVTDLCAAPDAVERLIAVAEARRSPIKCIQRIAVGGGPVDHKLGARAKWGFPNAEIHVVYGCTEAEPIARVQLDEVLEGGSEGCLVGRSVPEIDLVLAELPSDVTAPRTHDVEQFAVESGSVGEVVVRGRHVLMPRTRHHAGDALDRWHRTGDLARIDEAGRLWLLGRIGDVAFDSGRSVYPLPIEIAARNVAGVTRAAFIAVNAESSVLAFSMDPQAHEAEVTRGLRAMLDDRGLRQALICRLDAIPTDRRHRSKVDRIALRRKIAVSSR